MSDQAEQRFIELEQMALEYAQAQALAEHLAEFRNRARRPALCVKQR